MAETKKARIIKKITLIVLLNLLWACSCQLVDVLVYHIPSEYSTALSEKVLYLFRSQHGWIGWLTLSYFLLTVILVGRTKDFTFYAFLILLLQLSLLIFSIMSILANFVPIGTRIL